MSNRISNQRIVKKTINCQKKNPERNFVNVEYAFCNYGSAYPYCWSQSDTMCYCSDSQANWAKGGNGTIW